LANEIGHNTLYVLNLHRDAILQKWYGKITFQYEAGELVLIRKEETIKPPKQKN